MKRTADQALSEELKKAERQLETALEWEKTCDERLGKAQTNAEKARHNVGVALKRRDRVQEALAVLQGNGQEDLAKAVEEAKAAREAEEVTA